MTSLFRGIIEFFNDLGMYDVILPFLLVFTIVFAILERSKVLGVEVIDKQKYSKKNLNSLVSFVMAFFVIASTKLVAVISETMANMVLLLLLAVSFLLLIGSFAKETEDSVALSGTWKLLFEVIMFVGLVLIFLNALDWLTVIWDFVQQYTSFIAAMLFLLGIAGFVYFIARPESKKKGDDD